MKTETGVVDEEVATNVAVAAFVLGGIFGICLGVAISRGGVSEDAVRAVGEEIGQGIAHAACIDAGREWSLYPPYCEPPQ